MISFFYDTEACYLGSLIEGLQPGMQQGGPGV